MVVRRSRETGAGAGSGWSWCVGGHGEREVRSEKSANARKSPAMDGVGATHYLGLAPGWLRPARRCRRIGGQGTVAWMAGSAEWQLGNKNQEDDEQPKKCTFQPATRQRSAVLKYLPNTHPWQQNSRRGISCTRRSFRLEPQAASPATQAFPLTPLVLVTHRPIGSDPASVLAPASTRFRLTTASAQYSLPSTLQAEGRSSPDAVCTLQGIPS